MQEVKFCYQGLSIRICQRERSVWIKNRFLFTDASEFDCLLILEREGRRIREESLSLSLPPLSERKYALPDLPELPAGEYALTLSFRLWEDRPYAKRGYEIAFGQTVFRIEEADAFSPAGGAGGREKSGGEAFDAAADSASGLGLRSRRLFTGDGEESPGEAGFCGSFSFPDNYSAAKSGGLPPLPDPLRDRGFYRAEMEAFPARDAGDAALSFLPDLSGREGPRHPGLSGKRVAPAHAGVRLSPYPGCGL